MALLLAFLPSLAPAASDAETFRQDTLRGINAFRVAEGRTPVRLDDTLNGLAQEWAQKLAEEGRLQHRSLSNLREIQGANGYGTLNENLFMASEMMEPAGVVGAWKQSPPHRRNLLQGNIDRIGLGLREGPKGFYVVFNGAGAPPAPVVVPAPKSDVGVSFGGNPIPSR